MTISRVTTLCGVAALALSGAACGSSSSSPTGSTGTAGTSPTATSSPSTGGGSSGAPGALLAETKSAAAGDIPDNQVFLRYANHAGGYRIKYPEGWAIKRAGSTVTIQDKNNVVRLTSGNGPATVAQANADMQALAASVPGFSSKPPVANPSCTDMGKTVKLPLAGVHVVYSTRSKPNPVTGKRALLSVDRYYMARNGRRVVVDLGTPQGVDNVDAYCLMIASFAWQ